MISTEVGYRYSRLRIAFFAKEVPSVALGRAVYFPIKAMCSVLGIAAQAQVVKLRADSRIAPHLRDDIPIPTIKGLRVATCIRKQDVAMWLASIDPGKCQIGERTRTDLEAFQSALFAAADRWLFGDESDVVYDPGTKSDRPVYGRLHLGDCPRCGLPLCLVLDGVGPGHLAPDPDGED